jgi:alkanesulfonate monooxygenase SsuD/methylene tetrahydromethanopterin reductase-like flavin-dependent oxidoreductase (luciferase family)
MRFGVYLPTFGEYSDAGVLASLARDAETAGWHGVFVWDHLAMWWDRGEPVADTTAVLTAIALATDEVRFGALVTPLPRRRPWKFARETATLDRISNGRLVVGVGLGDGEHEFEELGEAAGLRLRAEMLDEGLAVVAGLWSGEPFSHPGPHYPIDEARFEPIPVQRPRIPVWVAVSWPHRGPVGRALRWDGAVVAMADPGPYNTPPEAYAEIRSAAPPGRVFDLVLVNGNPEWDLDRDGSEAARYEESGLTWWLEAVDPWRFSEDLSGGWPVGAMRERILAGPPRMGG